MERGGANAMDRISELPQFIIHQILSYLSTIEAAQTSVLSKTWLQAWSTSPNLNLSAFHFSMFPGVIDENHRHEFFSFVNNTLLRYRTHNLRIHKFKITLSTFDNSSSYRLLDQWIETALDQGVEELHITNILTSLELSPYTLPQTIFITSANALTDLTLVGCKFPQNFASNAINFPLLKKLQLVSAYIDDGMLQKLLSSCPSVENIDFNCVSGFKKFPVSNLGQLRILKIFSCAKKIEVDIEDAPSLHFLYYCCSIFHENDGSSRLRCCLKVGSAQNLKHLELVALIITDNFLNELITKFPLLEVLTIIFCIGLERINVSGRLLKHLLLKDCKNLVEANIDAPNLLTLEYNGDKVLSLSLVIFIAHQDFGWPDITWFNQFRLLKSVSRANVSFDICLKGVTFDTDLDPIENPLPLDQNFMPEINQSPSVFAAFVETLFSSSRPTTISARRWLSPDYVDFMKFLGNELIMATRNANCCSSDQETKCWRHYLKDINVEVYENSQNAWQPLPWETSLVKSVFLYEQIRFSLKWNSN